MDRSELGEWARQKIAEARSTFPDHITDDGKALELWGTIGSSGFVTSEGEVYLEEDSGPTPGLSVIRRDEIAVRTVLLIASKRHPELAACLPTRSAEDAGCSDCGETGWRTFGSHRFLCRACGGLGWLPPTPS